MRVTCGSRKALNAALEAIAYRTLVVTDPRTGESALVPGSGPEAAMHLRVAAMVARRTRAEVAEALLRGETIEARACTWRLA
jgi:hypothetical protein